MANRVMYVGFAGAAAIALSAFTVSVASAVAQQASPQGRDCQTVRTCNFSKTGAVRGCLSSYSCRTCRPVTVKCTLPGTSKCQELRCDWGG